jgi:hypothetical protein
MEFLRNLLQLSFVLLLLLLLLLLVNNAILQPIKYTVLYNHIT